MSKRWPDRLIVGLTGNIATGKSAVLQLAADRGALALDADRIVHDILDDDKGAQGQIATAFGDDIRSSDDRIDRQALATIVFNDPVALKQLEQILHPRVRKRLFERFKTSEASVVFIEAIKLLEGGLAKSCDQIWVTRCPMETQLERLMSIRGMDRDSAITRINAQPVQDEKVALADIVIDTGGTMADTTAQFELAWRRMAQSVPKLPIEIDSPTGSSPAEGPSQSSDIITSTEDTDETQPGDETGSGVEEHVDLPPQQETTARPDGVMVRRARPTDIPAVLLLIQQSTEGAVTMKRGELLLALGERGYLIGQKGIEISAVAGWNTENLVATIDQFFVSSAEAAHSTGMAILSEIEKTANELICEVILAFPLRDGPDKIRQLLVENGFDYVDPESLPKSWKATVNEVGIDDSLVMLKQLRETRQARIRFIRGE